MSVRILYS